jgi:hypothetical protein
MSQGDTEPPTSSSRRRAISILGLIVLPALAAVAVVLWAAEDRSAFGDATIDDVEQGIAAAGLQVCSQFDDPEGTANQAVRSRQYVLARNCDESVTGLLSVDEFNDVAHRDAAARNHEHHNRPRASGVVYTLGRNVVFVFGSCDHEIQEQLNDVLRDLGAR